MVNQKVETYRKESNAEVRQEIEKNIRWGYRVVSMYALISPLHSKTPIMALVVYEKEEKQR